MSAVRPIDPLLPSPDVDLAERLFGELRARTGDSGGITRASYGDGEQLAHDMVKREAQALGLAIRVDAGLNLALTLPGRTRAPAVVIGSHLDSVPCGGNYDGAAGVLMGLAVAAGFRKAGLVPSRDLTVLVTRAEESTWFNASYIGSRGVLGLIAAEELDTVTRSDTGRSLGDHIAALGGDPAALARGEAMMSPANVACFIEPHIEQGPQLIADDRPVGVVTGIRGSFRHRAAACLGAYGHSGTTPHALRRDAVVGASALVMALQDLWDRLEAAGEDLTVTLGQFATDPREHAFSKVPGRVDFALDVRSQSTQTLETVKAEAYAIATRIERQHRVRFDWGPLSGSRPAVMDAGVVDGLVAAAEAQGVAAPRMPCGAGHDAAVFANAGIPSGMLFIRNANGSHNPHEHMAMADFAAAANVLSRFCLEICSETP
ncbi:Zn-dependent hydrolase [uncultured Alsobacter sp.]|uniref:Zn-dependent hydrolase n=1 Tax=uncultured Alsobacter sp. TaxID=1748258 RepID=UPI0025E1FA8E|nr:Zn-dependent hydrolase [uncultured Alsobacter sp.]